MNNVCDSASLPGLTMMSQLIVLRVFTTLACGNTCCICSATDADPGPPGESTLATSTIILPSRLAAPAALKAVKELAPFVQLKTICPKADASANVPAAPSAPADLTHVAA